MKGKNKFPNGNDVVPGKVWDSLDTGTRSYVVIKAVRNRCNEDKVKSATELSILSAEELEENNPCAWRQISDYLSDYNRTK